MKNLLIKIGTLSILMLACESPKTLNGVIEGKIKAPSLEELANNKEPSANIYFISSNNKITSLASPDSLIRDSVRVEYSNNTTCFLQVPSYYLLDTEKGRMRIRFHYFPDSAFKHFPVIQECKILKKGK